MIPAGTDVTVSFPITGPVQSAQWRVIYPNADGSETRTEWADVVASDIGAEFVSVVVPAALNTINSFFQTLKDADTQTNMPNTTEARVVELKYVQAGIGTNVIQQEYTIRTDGDVLVVMQNSFQTYMQAATRAASIPNLEGWNSADADARKQALSFAYGYLSRLNYEVYYDSNDIYFRNRSSWGLPYINTIGRLYNYSYQDFAKLDPDFVQRICEAQIIEADDILGGNPEEADREKGLISKQVQEQIHVFRNSAPLRTSICRRTRRHLGGYLKKSVRLMRS